MKFKSVVITEKGAVKPDARKTIMKHIEKDPVGFFKHAEKVEGKNTYTVQIPDANGNIVYVNFDISVTAKNPANRAEKKAKPKAVAEAVEID